ncbi:unnamed protein product [Enterobius vermicularis]|uniref:Tumor necrosis factor alpha-induced protein 8-like protein n=1 Tax=Enterobius vermicularis TaxID=51028 RepID=A0A0N4VG02_ENTVE|nr:unnamed protein product [Enterobius vermicularis]
MNKQSQVAVIIQRDAEDHQLTSGSLAYRIEKKVLSKVFTRNLMKHFANDTVTCFFDDLYDLLEDYYGKTVAEKVIKDLIKLVIKLGITERSDHFTADQQKQLDQIRIHLRNLCLTVISFVNVSFSYNRDYLQSLFNDLYTSLRSVVETTLSEKSVRRVNLVYEYLSKEEFTNDMFKNGVNEKLRKVIVDLDGLLVQQNI